MRIGARTRVFAVLGDPVDHSLSPPMQNAAFIAAGVDAVYVALRPAPHDVAALMTTLVRNGGGGNLTIPFKVAAAGAECTRDARVEVLGAANVFGPAAPGVHVGNTDVDGIIEALRQLDVQGDAWLVLGTGGSARAVAGAARECGARLAVRSREPARASEFAAWIRSIGIDPAETGECRAVINATPLGLAAGDRLPIEPRDLPEKAVVLDLVYSPLGPTAWVRACRARGITATDGREVLLAQGAASWAHWFTGVTPPIEVMRAALDGRLG